MGIYESNGKQVEVTYDKILRTTENARLLKFDDKEVWVAKTISNIVDANIIELPVWLILREELEDYRCDL